MDWKQQLESLKNGMNLTSESPEVNQTEDNAQTAVPPDNATNDAPQKEPLHVVTDRKGRKGKTATIIEGFTCSESEIEKTAASLKKKLGTGGSSRGSEILIQGDRKTEVEQALISMGFKVKK